MSKPTFETVYQQSITDPNKFWLEASQTVSWYQPPARAYSSGNTDSADTSQSITADWFAGGKLNSCYNALDRHVEAGFGEQTAIIHDSPVTNSKTKISYQQLLDEVIAFAAAMDARGISKGDRVVIYMPMIPQAVVAMLACARIGAIHSVVFGGFAANELAKRINDAEPKAIISASCGVEVNRIIDYKSLLDTAIELADCKPEFRVIYQREQMVAELDDKVDIDWLAFTANAGEVDCVALDATDPLYILYTSGTTGKPKGVVRDNGGHCVALSWSMQNIYNVQPGDVYWAASDIGWVVGHSYIVYGPLFNRNTTILYEGKPVGTPNAGAFWRVISDYQVKTLFTAPTAIRAIKCEDPEGDLLQQNGIDLSSLKALFLAGERSDPATLHWAEEKLGVPVIDHWWQTETGWSICANCLGIEQLPVIHGSPSKPVVGYQLVVLDKDGQQQQAGEIGSLAIKSPLPPGTFSDLWQDHDRFVESYFGRFTGYYETGDAGFIDENGYVFVMSRTDDIINVAGHRLSTGSIEEVIAGHPAIAECAVIGMPDDLKGEIPVALIVLSHGKGQMPSEEQIEAEAIKRVRDNLGAVYSFKSCIFVSALPKTRSGKVLRGTMKKMASGDHWEMPATIDNADTLQNIATTLDDFRLHH